MANDREPVTSISEQASHWWVVLHGEDASSEDHREFGEWVARSPERVEAYMRTATLMRALKSPTVRWPDTPSEVLIRESKESPPDTLQLSRAPVQEEDIRPDPPLHKRWAWSIASILSVALVFALLTLPHSQRYGTRLGEQRLILLDDGSRVTLNTASRIEVDLGRDRRTVRMIEGEALFEVAHELVRPFDVEVRGAVVRAVGTQFDVDLRPSRTTVTVLEGRVALSRPTARESGSALILAAAQRLVITTSGPGTPEHVGNLAAATSWTQGQLIFQRTPLREVAEEFNRYNRGRIVIDSESLKQQEVTGVFQSNDPASFVAFLSNIPGVQIRSTAQGDHVVSLNGGQP